MKRFAKLIPLMTIWVNLIFLDQSALRLLTIKNVMHILFSFLDKTSPRSISLFQFFLIQPWELICWWWGLDLGCCNPKMQTLYRVCQSNYMSSGYASICPEEWLILVKTLHKGVDFYEFPGSSLLCTFAFPSKNWCTMLPRPKLTGHIPCNYTYCYNPEFSYYVYLQSILQKVQIHILGSSSTCLLCMVLSNVLPVNPKPSKH